MESQNLKSKIVIYSDGACSGNPGPGGWGSIVATPDGTVRELGGGDPRTTNNQMELMGVAEAFRLIASVSGDVVVFTDSVYVIRGITQWIWGWLRNGWKTAEGKEVLNREFWQMLSELVSARKSKGTVAWRYVRGHVGIEGNERCDAIAVAFSKGQSISLFNGSADHYRFPIYQDPPEEPLPEMTGKKGEKKAAFSYLSLLGATPMRHATWADCERRVKGQPGAKFKKAMSKEEESQILESWGVDPKLLKS